MSEQQREPLLSINPETAHHARIIRQGRRDRRRSGWLTLIASLIVLVGCVFLLGVGVAAHVPLTPVLLAFLGIMALAGAAGILAAITDLTAGAKPVTVQEVQAQRQQTREELLRRAQGHLPFYYRRPAIILEIAIGCLWGLMGVASLIAVPVSPFGWLDILMAILFLVGFLAFLGDALLTRPREAKRLAARSAEELARRLALGEITEGHTSDGE